MTFSSPAMPECIEIHDGECYVLAVENPGVLRRLIEDLREQWEGGSGSAAFLEKGEPVAIGKRVEMLEGFAPFILQSKSLSLKLNRALEKEAQQHFLTETAQLTQQIEAYLYKISEHLPFGVISTGISASSLIKCAGMAFEGSGIPGPGDVLDYMDAVSFLDGEKLFVSVAMACFYDREQMEAFAETVKSKQYKMLMLEPVDCHPLLDGGKTVIDRDCCVI